MSELDPPPVSPYTPPKSGWDAVDTLEIRHKAADRPTGFNLGPWVWLWLGSCAVIAMLLESAQHTSSSAELSGRTFGAGLAVWLLAYGLGWLLFRVSGRNLTAGRVAVCVLAALMVISKLAQSGLAVSEQRHADQVTVANDLRDDLKTLSQGADGDGPIPTLNPNATVGGDLGDLQLFIKAYLNNVISLQNEYAAELNSIGWNQVLDPDRLRKDKDLVESKALVARAQATVEKYRQRWVSLAATTQASVDRMDANTAAKRGFVQGFRTSAEKGNARANEMWELEAGVVANTEHVIELLAANRGSWSFEDGQFVFADQRTLDAFNVYVERMNVLSAREEAIRSQSMADAEASLKRVAE